MKVKEINDWQESKVRLLLLADSKSGGGVARYISELSQSLTGNVDFNFVDAANREHYQADRLTTYSGLVGEIRKAVALTKIVQFVLSLDLSQYDIVHFLHYSAYALLVIFWHKMLKGERTQMILTVHGMKQKEEYFIGIVENLFYKKLAALGERFVHRRVDQLIYVSEAQKRDFFLWNPNEAGAKVAHLSIQLPKRSSVTTRMLVDMKTMSQLILFVGRIERRKRIENFIELSRLLPDLRFEVIGRASDTAYVTRLKLSAPENLVFRIGATDQELFSAYHEARFLVTFSSWEYCPVTYLEAIAHGTPVVGASQPLRILTESGCAFAALTPSDAVERIRRLSNPKTLSRAVSRCLYVSGHFSRWSMARKTLKIYSLVSSKTTVLAQRSGQELRGLSYS